MERDAFRRLPAVTAVLESESLVSAVQEVGRAAVVRTVRRALEEARSGLRKEGRLPPV